MKKKEGITLIALVITVVVLIILAMVTISMVTDSNGIISRANESQIENAHGEVRERLQIEAQAYYAEKLDGRYTYGLLQYLKDKNFIEEDGKVNVEKLLEKEIITGSGEGKTDIYKVEELEKEELTKYYAINYYSKNEEVRKIRRTTR